MMGEEFSAAYPEAEGAGMEQLLLAFLAWETENTLDI
jgi:hypothetical protein